MSKDIILAGFIVSIVIGLLITLLMSYSITSTIWIWLSMLINMICLILLAVFSYSEYLKTLDTRCYKAENINGCGGTRANTFIMLTYFFAFIGIVYLVGILFFFRKIFLASKIFRKAAFLFKRTW
jgi:hypothetical protein